MNLHYRILILAVLLFGVFLFVAYSTPATLCKANVATAALLPFAVIPRFARKRKDKNSDLNVRYFPPNVLITRHGGRLVSRANEDVPAGGAADPAGGADAPLALQGQFRVLDAHGREIGLANAERGADGAPFAVMRGNAVTAQGTAINQALTAYANGYPADNVGDVVNHFAPSVPVPLLFSYVAKDLANELGAEDADKIGATGEPSVVHMNPESRIAGQLLYRGLETPFTSQDQTIAGSMPGNSIERERQRRTRFLLGITRRGRALRTYALVQASASTATGVTIYLDQDPIKDLRDYINAVILEAGSPEYVSCCMGYAVLNGFQDHPILNGTALGYRNDLSLEQICSKMGLRPANCLVSYHQVVTTAQGKSAAKSTLIGSDQLYLHVCRPQPTEDDNSWLKTFSLAGTGAGAAGSDPFSVYNYNLLGRGGERIGLDYWELQKRTNASANAFRRLAITFANSNTPSE